MVYCSRCGTQNLNTNVHCINCGAPLYTVGERYPGSDREQYRKMEDECFGLPNGGMIAAFIIGIIILLVGLGLLIETSFGISINFWPLIIIIFGVLLVVGALYKYRRTDQFFR
ncbi:MAG: zinc-ribbon domain-containing protein [Candidatus Bathyarchaeia archaeon]